MILKDGPTIATKILTYMMTMGGGQSTPREHKPFPMMVVSSAEDIAAWNAEVDKTKKEQALRNSRWRSL